MEAAKGRPLFFLVSRGGSSPRPGGFAWPARNFGPRGGGERKAQKRNCTGPALPTRSSSGGGEERASPLPELVLTIKGERLLHANS